MSRSRRAREEEEEGGRGGRGGRGGSEEEEEETGAVRRKRMKRRAVRGYGCGRGAPRARGSVPPQGVEEGNVPPPTSRAHLPPGTSDALSLPRQLPKPFGQLHQTCQCCASEFGGVAEQTPLNKLYLLCNGRRLYALSAFCYHCTRHTFWALPIHKVLQDPQRYSKILVYLPEATKTHPGDTPSNAVHRQ